MSNANEQDTACMVFAAAGVHYGVPARYVVEVTKPPRVTALPRQMRALQGLFARKGVMVPVYDLSVLACAEGEAAPEEQPACVCVLVKHEGHMAGLAFQEAVNMAAGESQSESALDIATGGLLEFSAILSGDDPVFVLDVPKVFQALKVAADSE